MNYKIREIQKAEYPLLDDFFMKPFFSRKVLNHRQNPLLQLRNYKFILTILEILKTTTVLLQKPQKEL